MPKFVEGYADKLVVPEGATDVQVFDSELPGFGIRKFAKGHASYFVKFNVGPQQRRKTLGKVTKGNLKAMRLEASAILAKARLGTDVVAETKAAAGKVVVTLGELIPKYLAVRERGDHGFKKLSDKWQSDVELYLAGGKHTAPAFKELEKVAIGAITRDNVAAVIDGLAEARGKFTADRARAALSGLYAWAIERRYCETNPTLSVRQQAPSGGRERTLTEAELVEVWNACLEAPDAPDGMPKDYPTIVKLLVLSGCRREEIGGLCWSEVNRGERQILFPSARTKNGKEFVLPASDELLALLPARVEGGGTRDPVFGRGVTGYSAWSRGKRLLDERIARAREKAGIKEPMPGWHVHDLRRTFVTIASEKDLADPHVIEAAVNHISGAAKAGVAGTYNRAKYLPQKRQLFDVWGKFVTELVTGVPSKVVPLIGRQRAAS
jgi:integrase